MIDRRLLRDIAAAVFLAVSTIALASPHAVPQTSAPAVQPLVVRTAG